MYNDLARCPACCNCIRRMASIGKISHPTFATTIKWDVQEDAARGQGESDDETPTAKPKAKTSKAKLDALMAPIPLDTLPTVKEVIEAQREAQKHPKETPVDFQTVSPALLERYFDIAEFVVGQVVQFAPREPEVSLGAKLKAEMAEEDAELAIAIALDAVDYAETAVYSAVIARSQAEAYQ